VVGKVLKNSPAEKAGFKKGDRILAVNNQPVKFWYQISEEIEKSPYSLLLW